MYAAKMFWLGGNLKCQILVSEEEYLNWIPDAEKDDARTLMPSFFAALQQVYAQNYESAVPW